MIKINLCLLIHNWEYYLRKLNCIFEGSKENSTINVNFRKCTRCNKVQHHMMPRHNGVTNWKDFNSDHNNIMVFNKA
jgi:hypothetical protein